MIGIKNKNDSHDSLRRGGPFVDEIPEFRREILLARRTASRDWSVSFRRFARSVRFSSSLTMRACQCSAITTMPGPVTSLASRASSQKSIVSFSAGGGVRRAIFHSKRRASTFGLSPPRSSSTVLCGAPSVQFTA